MCWQAEEGFLGELKAYQDRVQLKDEMAVEVMQEAARAKLERHIGTALDCIKKRTRVRDYTPATQVCPVQEIRQNKRLLQLCSGIPNKEGGGEGGWGWGSRM